MVINIWRCSSISFKHATSWRLLFDWHWATFHNHIGGLIEKTSHLTPICLRSLVHLRFMGKSTQTQVDRWLHMKSISLSAEVQGVNHILLVWTLHSCYSAEAQVAIWWRPCSMLFESMAFTMFVFEASKYLEYLDSHGLNPTLDIIVLHYARMCGKDIGCEWDNDWSEPNMNWLSQVQIFTRRSVFTRVIPSFMGRSPQFLGRLTMSQPNLMSH